MKKYIFAILAAVMCVLSVSADTYTINRDKLPQAAQEMLTKYFPKSKVSMIKVDKHLLRKTDYDVRLVNGTKIEFSNSGSWTSVDGKGKELPSDLIPSAIKRYVNKNYADTKIVKIVKKTTAYEIELSSGVELKFDRLGNFKKIIGLDD